MGIAAADFSADGRPDLLVTNSHRQLHGVFESSEPDAGGALFADGRPTFAPAFDTTLAGWGVSSADLDLDGDLDLVLANGAIPVTDLAADAEPIQVLENLSRWAGGRIADASSVLGVESRPRVIGRGLAAADYDNDGDVDVAVNSIGGPLVLLENDGAAGRWLEVELGTFAPGTRVTAVLPDGRRLVREVQAGSSYLSSEDPRIHFGLGDATTVSELLVRFPDGRETRLEDVPADRSSQSRPSRRRAPGRRGARCGDRSLPGVQEPGVDRPGRDDLLGAERLNLRILHRGCVGIGAGAEVEERDRRPGSLVAESSGGVLVHVVAAIYGEENDAVPALRGLSRHESLLGVYAHGLHRPQQRIAPATRARGLEDEPVAWRHLDEVDLAGQIGDRPIGPVESLARASAMETAADPPRRGRVAVVVDRHVARSEETEDLANAAAPAMETRRPPSRGRCRPPP